MRVIIIVVAIIIAVAWVYGFVQSRRAQALRDPDSVSELSKQASIQLAQAGEASRKGQGGLAEEHMKLYEIIVSRMEQRNQEQQVPLGRGKEDD